MYRVIHNDGLQQFKIPKSKNRRCIGKSSKNSIIVYKSLTNSWVSFDKYNIEDSPLEKNLSNLENQEIKNWISDWTKKQK